MLRRLLDSPNTAPFALDLSAEELLADLDPGWLAWQATLDAEITTAA